MPHQFKRYGTFREFTAEYAVDIPDNYNFAFDFLDAQAAQDPHRRAMIHVGPGGERRDLDLEFFRSESARMANAFKALGIAKGDIVMVVLQRRVEFWVTILALSKMGAIAVPSPHLLMPHDIEYRMNKAGIKACVAEEDFVERVEAVRAQCPSLKVMVRVGQVPVLPGWTAYEAVRQAASDQFPRPADSVGGHDTLFVFFSSGTTGMPKMVVHTHAYPLGHVTTAVYWHDLRPDDIHLTVADTGWGKSIWGKFHGQWIAQATVFVWDYRGKFVPSDLLKMISDHKVTTLCVPPTIYRFLVREDLSTYDLSNLRHCTTAGELLNEGVFHAWKKATGLSIYEGYGQTETCLQIAAFPFMTVPQAWLHRQALPGLERGALG